MASVDPAAPADVSLPHAEGALPVEVAWSDGPRQVRCRALRLPPGSTALDALRAADLAATLGAAVLDGLQLALWGRVCGPETVLQAHDRLELLRPLQVDPKEARRLRYRRDGIRPRRKAPRR